MPGSTMGQRARWSDIEEIKERLLEPARERLGKELGRPTDLVIEKDKLTSGPIHPSMFREAADSDVYIADLSGANPNVYLELGVRWALRDGVTILISQDIDDDVKFNVSGNRVIPYGPMPNELDRAISKIVASALSGMQDPPPIDSPVRNSLPLLTAPRTEWDNLRNEIARLKQSQADDLVAAARKAPPAQAIELLRQAVDRNPVSLQAHYQLGIALRKAADYPGAISESAVPGRRPRRPGRPRPSRRPGDADGRAVAARPARSRPGSSRRGLPPPAAPEPGAGVGPGRRRARRGGRDGRDRAPSPGRFPGRAIPARHAGQERARLLPDVADGPAHAAVSHAHGGPADVHRDRGQLTGADPDRACSYLICPIQQPTADAHPRQQPRPLRPRLRRRRPWRPPRPRRPRPAAGSGRE